MSAVIFASNEKTEKGWEGDERFIVWMFYDAFG